MQPVNVCRPLGAGEQIFWLHDQAHPLHFALTAQIKGQFTVHQLQQALNLVQQLSTHPSPNDALQAFKDQLGYDIAVSNLTRLTIEQQFGELEL